MHPPKTYELKLNWLVKPQDIPKLKKRVIDFLLFSGVESFVEGSLDVDINQNQDEPPRDHYGEMGGDCSPMSVYRYSRESLEDIQTKIQARFIDQVELSIETMETSTWMDGWKDSFKPFQTEIFYVRPPWEPAKALEDLVELIIEPGMAFGTGQHATTKLCLNLLSYLIQDRAFKPLLPKLDNSLSVLDVGTGTGILAIAAKKCGFKKVVGSDIEEDAILASKENAKLNGVTCEWILGSLPQNQQNAAAVSSGAYDLLFANILAVVILRLLDDLKSSVKPGGYLILSGILESEADEVMKACDDRGLKEVKVLGQDGWSALLFRKVES